MERDAALGHSYSPPLSERRVTGRRATLGGNRFLHGLPLG